MSNEKQEKTMSAKVCPNCKPLPVSGAVLCPKHALFDEVVEALQGLVKSDYYPSKQKWQKLELLLTKVKESQ